MNNVAEKPQGSASEHHSERPFVSPEVNIYETGDGYVLQAEMPGVSREGLDLSLEGNTLTLVGRRSAGDSAGEVLYRESRAVDYRRAFELDPAIDSARISAQMHQGLLTLTLPKTERVRPRKIEIQ